MRSRPLLVLGALAFIVIVAAIWVANVNTPDREQSFDLLYPGLSPETDDVKAVRVFKAGGQRSVEIKQTAGQWTVTERYDYPADLGKVRALLDALHEARVIEAKTTDAASYAALGVEDVSSPQARGVQLTIEGTRPPVDLIVGKRGMRSDLRYVRRSGEPQSWLVSGDLSASTQPQNWLSSRLLDIAAERIHEIELAIGSQPPFKVTKASRDDADFTVSPLPTKRELKSPDIANELARVLTNLQLQDVRPTQDFDPKSRATRATVRTFDGLQFELNGWGRDSAYFITIEPKFDEALAQRYLTDLSAPADAAPTTPATDSTGALEQRKKEAEQLRSQLAPWAYQISQAKYDAIFKSVDQLLK